MDQISEKIVHMAERYPEIKKVILFGSRARGDYHAQSDYDIAIYSEKSTFEQKSHFLNDIDELDTLYKIDVIVMNQTIDPVLVKNIEKEGVVLMERENKRSNYLKAVSRLEEALKQCENTTSDLFRDGVIQRFEFSTELAWKACREYLLDLGYTDINGPKPVMREAFSYGMILDSDAWIAILNDRNLTSHIYNESTADEIFERIKSQHIQQLLKLSEYFQKN